MDVLDPKALRHFLTVARIGSIRGAAEHLNLAASIVSRQIADIEHQLGLSIFERTARGVVLTEAGQLVLDHARRIFDDRGLLGEQLDQLRGVQQGRVRIICGEGFVADLVENGLPNFIRIYPTVRLTLDLGSTEVLLDSVSNGDADIGVVYNPVIDTRIKSLAISRQPLCLVAPPSHTLLTRKGLSLADCLAEPCALLMKGHGVRQLVGRVAADLGLALAPVLETGSIDVLRRFVSTGLGITFLPRFAVATETTRKTIGVADLSDPLLKEASSHLIVRARRRLPTSVDRLAGHLSQKMVAFGK
jgi:DNA-binding transcriptional LysR family regulator